MNPKTGLVAVVVALKAICRTLDAYQPKMVAGINAAQSAGKISPSQASALISFLDTVRFNCDILRAATGY